jgi:iron complex transport system substrate-binding protein
MVLFLLIFGMKKTSTYFVYFGAAILLTVWWGAAFRHHPATTSSTKEIQPSPIDLSVEEKHLSSFVREELIQALAGNYTLMAKLIQEWDVDALLLENLGISGVSRLSQAEYLRSQLIARRLQQPISQYEKKRFLPQTYAAATFLLALATPEQIVALPRGFRQHQGIYPVETIQKISLDIDRHLSEAIFLTKPSIAFVAPYSHPSTVEALRNQGITLFNIHSLDSFEDICQVVLGIGHAIESQQEAELLKIFMEAAMFAIDNRLAYAVFKHSLPRTLYVGYHSSFSLPTKKNLTGQLLIRMGVMDHMEELEIYAAQHQWSIPIDQEKIVNFKPECLIISTDNTQGLKKWIDTDPAFEGLRKACDRISYVNEDIVSSPTQYIVLAYYDLVQTVTQR